MVWLLAMFGTTNFSSLNLILTQSLDNSTLNIV
ncbi:MAG: hypothetical protein EOP34_01395 [Rickettsiales bacterium]|nr:MAG: hypothetical protein EOP34_01395 [Rickettsiales bacterium]